MMKFILVLAILVVSTQAFSIKSTGALRSQTSRQAKSESVPFLEKPPALDGSMVGDVGFDPLGFSNAWLDVREIFIYNI